MQGKYRTNLKNMRFLSSCPRLALSFLALGTITFLAACGSSEKELPPPPAEISNRDVAPLAKAPVKQVKQTLNLGAADTLSAALDILKRQNLSIERFDPVTGLIETSWVEMSDRHCGRRSFGAPVRCRSSFAFKVDEFENIHSVVNARFEQRCSMNEDLPLSCLASEGERIMVSVIDELRALDEAVTPKPGWWTVTKSRHQIEPHQTDPTLE